MMRKNQEISELKSRIAEVMALIPQPPTYPSKLDSPGPIGGGGVGGGVGGSVGGIGVGVGGIGGGGGAAAAAAAASVSMGGAGAQFSKFCPSMSSPSPLNQLQQQPQQHHHPQTSLASLYPIGGHRLGGIGNMPSMPIGGAGPSINMNSDAYVLSQQQHPPQQQQQAGGKS